MATLSRGPTAGKGFAIDVWRIRSLASVSLALGGLIAAASLAGAQDPSPDNSPHLLIVPDTPRGVAALERSDARVIASYGEFSLVEARGGDDAALRGAGADRRDDMRKVSLAGGEHDPLRERESLAGKGLPSRGEELVLVQFVGPVKDAWLARLRSTGARIVEYAAQNGYLLHASGGEVDRLAGLVGTDPAVRAVTAVTPQDKLAEDLSASEGDRPVAVQSVAGAEGSAARAAAAGAGRSLRGASEVGERQTQFLSLNGPETARLAADPAVLAIVPYSRPRLLDERSAQIVAGNLTAGGLLSGTGYLPWLTARGFPGTTLGFAIDVTDEGLDRGNASGTAIHPDFLENGTGAERVSYATDYTGDGTARDCNGHGTNVASIAAGYGLTGANRADAQGYRHGLGVAPRVRVGASKIFSCGGDFSLGANTLSDVASAAYAGGARVSNNSWGNSDLGRYGVDSQEYDALVRDAQPGVAGHQPMVEVFAAGNDGENADAINGNAGWASVGSPGTAKNVITVGASESQRPIGKTDGCGVSDLQADKAADIIDFSSRGPTDDLRQKPDLVAPGTHVVGAAPQSPPAYTGARTCEPQFPSGNALYSLVSGTSQAAPAVSGAAALISDWYARSHGGVAPSPALVKAILVNAATDIAGGADGKGSTIGAVPSPDQGWGRVNVGAALDSTVRDLRDQTELVDHSGQSNSRSYSVADTARPLKITLAWTDPPGPLSATALVNNLDLVVRQGGRTYRGNVMAGGRSIAGGGADIRNNLESVILPAGSSGRVAVEVLGTSILGDGVPGNGDLTDQDYALVVSNAESQPAPVLAEDGVTITDSADADAALEPDEPFSLDVGVQNGGDAEATGVSGTVSSGSVDFGADSSTWPDIDAAGEGVDSSEVGSTSFEGVLSPGARCGTEVPGTLALATDQGAQTVPITLPTGQTGTAVTRAQTHVAPGLAIPDESAVGVSSTVAVTQPGRIKDLDVRISDIDHNFVGDLALEVTGPDGTTVVLARHPGGPDNNGNNFVNTVFDDEAATSISAGTAPYSGSFRPQSDQLSRFDGKQQQGTWTLRVRDLFEGDAGTLDAWATLTSPAVCNFDTAAPETQLEATPPDPDTSNDPTFDFSSDETGAEFECKLDTEPAFAACGPPRSYTNVPDGTRTFSVRAVDGSGNVDATPAEHTWTVDTTAPETSITSGPSGRVSSTSASFAFSSSDPSADYKCSLDGAAFEPCGPPKAYSDLPDGAHSFAVRATDPVGNTDPSPATRQWTVDTVGPTGLIVSPPNGDVSNDRTPTVRGTAGTGPGDLGSATIRIYQGSGTGGAVQQSTLVTPGPGGAWSFTSATLPVGTYTVRAEQGDQAGNTGFSAESTFTIVSDFVAPNTTILSGPAGFTASRDAAFRFSSSEPGAEFLCSLDGAPASVCGATLTLRGVAQGAHTLRVRAKDPADNVDASAAERSWTVDVTAPKVSLTAPAAGASLVDPGPRFAGAAGAAVGDAASITLKLWRGTLAAGLAEQTLVVARDPATGAWSTPPSAALADGTWTARAEQTDAAGNTGASALVSFVVDTAGPEFAVVPTEIDLTTLRARRATLMAGCGSACAITAELRTAGRRPVLLGRGAGRLTGQGTKTVRLKLVRAGRAATRGAAAVRAKLRVTVTAGDRRLRRTRSVVLRKVGLSRAVGRGMPFAGFCSEPCSLRSNLLMKARDAERLGLRVSGSAPARVGGASVDASSTPSRFVVKMRRSSRAALRRARRLRVTLETFASARTGPELRASQRATLRR